MKNELWYTPDKYSFDDIAKLLQDTEKKYHELNGHYFLLKSCYKSLKNYVPEDTVINLVKEKKRIEAIKLYRMLNDGITLKEAKDHIDKLYSEIKK